MYNDIFMNDLLRNKRSSIKLSWTHRFKRLFSEKWVFEISSNQNLHFIEHNFNKDKKWGSKPEKTTKKVTTLKKPNITNV